MMSDHTTLPRNPARCRGCAVGRARDNGLCLTCTVELQRRAAERRAGQHLETRRRR